MLIYLSWLLHVRLLYTLCDAVSPLPWQVAVKHVAKDRISEWGELVRSSFIISAFLIKMKNISIPKHAGWFRACTCVLNAVFVICL